MRLGAKENEKICERIINKKTQIEQKDNIVKFSNMRI